MNEKEMIPQFQFESEGWRGFEIYCGDIYAVHLKQSTNWKLIPPDHIRQKFFEWLFENYEHVPTLQSPNSR